jgi:23S rRNA A2030 N6-methylase RlmJ
MAWRTANISNTPESFQSFVDKYPRSRHAADTRNSIALLNDQASILQLLKGYQDSFNHHNVRELLQLWPDCPPYVQTLLKDKRSGTVSLSANGSPDVKGEMASLKVVLTRRTETEGGSVKTVPFSFKKVNGRWVIYLGSL